MFSHQRLFINWIAIKWNIVLACNFASICTIRIWWMSISNVPKCGFNHWRRERKIFEQAEQNDNFRKLHTVAVMLPSKLAKHNTAILQYNNNQNHRQYSHITIYGISQYISRLYPRKDIWTILLIVRYSRGHFNIHFTAPPRLKNFWVTGMAA